MVTYGDPKKLRVHYRERGNYISHAHSCKLNIEGGCVATKVTIVMNDGFGNGGETED